MKQSSRARVCIILPAWNEGEVIGDLIDALFAALKKSPYTGEVVVINDGSKDNTSSIARKHGATTIDHILNTGQGGAVATGLRYAEKELFDIAITMDADGQHDVRDTFRGIDELIRQDADLLIGSRLIDSKGMSRVKIIGNKGLSFITYALFGVKSTDSQSGLRVFSRRAIETLRWKAGGYEFCSEMLWRAHQKGLAIGEYSIKAIYTDYSTSGERVSGQNNWNGINIVKTLIRERIVEIFE